jgi:ketosteroid isomerase-like protein
LLPALVRNEVREVFADGDRACVVYDFVTDTAAGAVPCVELVTVRDGRITGIELIFDRVAFAPVNEALAAR